MHKIDPSAVTDGPPEDGRVCDLLVIGSGASGFAAALTARRRGLDVLMLEKTSQFGGTTVSSAGVIWIPGSRHAREAGKKDSPEAVVRYLTAEGGNRLDLDKAEIYARRAPEILDWFEDHSALSVALAPAWPDYHPTQPGGSSGGRSLGPTPFDGRSLEPHFSRLRPPIATTMILGGMIVGREDLGHFYGMTRSMSSAQHVMRLFLRYARDRLSYPRGTRLSNGSALIGMLARSAFDSGVRLHVNTPFQELITEQGEVVGATAAGRRILSRSGVVLATGGFPGDAAMRAKYYEHVGKGRSHHSVAPKENTGDGLRAAAAIGAGLVEEQRNPAAWTPVSLAPQPDGGLLPFPHFFDRGKAGYIAVDRRGRRFVSEAVSYHDFVPAMIDACRDDDDVWCHLICDSEAIRRYGLGLAPPSPGQVGPHVRSGYLHRADTLQELARKCGIDPEGLERTVSNFNTHAARGDDPEFGKGGDVYERFNGSAGQTPNPCIAPLQTAPFYAIKLYAGDIGTFNGVRTDAHCRALTAAGAAITGLYVIGNDAASFMGGAYPGAGITLGPALVFGHIAANHAADRLSSSTPAAAHAP